MNNKLIIKEKERDFEFITPLGVSEVRGVVRVVGDDFEIPDHLYDVLVEKQILAFLEGVLKGHFKFTWEHFYFIVKFIKIPKKQLADAMGVVPSSFCNASRGSFLSKGLQRFLIILIQSELQRVGFISALSENKLTYFVNNH